MRDAEIIVGVALMQVGAVLLGIGLYLAIMAIIGG